MRRSQRELGFALVTALSFVIIIGVVVGTALYLSATNRRLSAETVRTTQAQYAAEAGIEQVVRTYWTDIWAANPPGTRTLRTYRSLLNPVLANGATKTLPAGDVDGNTYNVTVRRVDQTLGPQITSFIITSTGKTADGVNTRVLSQTLRIAPRNYAGLQYALLSNNVNCTFCHTKIETMEGAYGNTAGGKDRVKVGTLESLELRVAGRNSFTDAVDTAINGTLYTRGKVLDQNRNDYNLGETNDINFTKTDTNGKVAWDPNKTRPADNLEKANIQDCTKVTCTANNNFYQNYTSGSGADGDLPTSFPQPVPDNNAGLNDRFTSNSEWAEYITDTVAEEGKAGTLSVAGAGSSMLYKETAVSDNKQQQLDIKVKDKNFSSIVSTADRSNTVRGVTGNLKIKGNMRIDGTVFVDGDVIISGRLSGTGKIIARGNIYVTGDIEYNCGSDTAPADCDYSDSANLPQLALVSGGNTLVGDYLSGNKASRDDLRTSTTMEPGFPSNFENGGKLSYVAAEIANFNKLEYTKARANSSYIPRFYRMRPGDPIIRYTGNGENASNYNIGQLAGVDGDIECNKKCKSKSLSNDTDRDIYNRSRVLDLSPADNWQSEGDVKQAWIDNIETPTRPKAKFPLNTTLNKPLQLDATIYTSNAAFALARGCQNTGPCGDDGRSKLQGRIVMNGSLIAADSGVLSPGEGGKQSLFQNGDRDIGLRIHYDARIQNLISLGKGDVVNLSRSDFQLTGR